MPTSSSAIDNLAIQAANDAEERVFERIKSGKGFIMEAGAGAGKTTSLKRTLEYVLNTQSLQLKRNNQMIACITYTEAATSELKKGIDNNPAVYISTIHSFCWSLISSFQKSLLKLIQEIPQWNEKLSEVNENNLSINKVMYDKGYRTITGNEIHLHHDDVPLLMAKLLENNKFSDIFVGKFPILLIDEYQDTNKILMSSIITNILERRKPLVVGLFGDHWQRIYDDVCGKVEHSELELIKKHANFRSSKTIVDLLNKIRPGLEQFPADITISKGGIKIFHTNLWAGERGTGQHHIGSLPNDVAHQYFDKVKNILRNDSWNFENRETKILLLTNNMLAKEQGYTHLLDNFPFPTTERLLRVEDDHIKYFIEVIEPACNAYNKKRYGEMLSLINAKGNIKSHKDKLKWAVDMRGLIVNRDNGTIGDVIDYLYKIKRPRLSDKIIKQHEELLNVDQNKIADLEDNQRKKIERLIELRKVPYVEVKLFHKYSDGLTPFSTNHKVKGAEFDDVLVVFSQGWSKYNFDKMLSMNNWDTDGDDISLNQKFFEDNRNLFYVVCSRPRKRLTLLFTHQLSDKSLEKLSSWFGDDNIFALKAI